MRLRALVRPVPAEWLLGSGTLLLVIFHYLLRADTVGVFSRERGWHPLTQGPVPLPLHYLAAALVLGVLPLILARAATGKSLAQLGLGIGIATGYATIGRIGFEGRYDYGAVGTSVILASRLSSAAKAAPTTS